MQICKSTSKLAIHHAYVAIGDPDSEIYAREYKVSSARPFFSPAQAASFFPMSGQREMCAQGEMLNGLRFGPLAYWIRTHR
jgi:hypothetical protein